MKGILLKNKRALVVSTLEDGFESLWIDKKLICQGNPVNEGTDRALYFMQLNSEYDLSVQDYLFVNVTEDGNKIIESYGEFSKNYEDLIEILDL